MPVRLVWVTGISGAGKSTVCQALKSIGITAIDTDWDGFNQWVHCVTGEPVVDPPYPTPANWLDTHAWHIRPERNREQEPSYRRVGATIINSTRPVDEIVDAVLHLGDGL